MAHGWLFVLYGLVVRHGWLVDYVDWLVGGECMPDW